MQGWLHHWDKYYNNIYLIGETYVCVFQSDNLLILTIIFGTEHNQTKLGQQLAETAAHISGLSRRAQTMNEVLKNVTSELKQQRKDTFGDVGKLEMKYLEQCALLPLQVRV